MQLPKNIPDTNKIDLKVVLVGATCVGKTCIITYYDKKNI